MAVGSSRMMHLGSIAITPAIETLCFCPPESLLGDFLRCSSMPTAARLSSTRFQISSVGTPIFSGPNPTSSSTTWAMIWLSGFWNTMPASLRISHRCALSLVSMPSTQTVPSVGNRSAFKCLASVDLPDPLWPRTAMNWPGCTSRSTPLMARTVPATFPSSSLFI